MPLTIQEKKDWVRLALSENVGPVAFRHMLGYFGSAKEALSHVDEFARRGGRQKPIILATERQASEQLEQAEQVGAEIVPWCDPDYPKLLKAIEDAPAIIFVKGFMELAKKNTIGIVGTRNASLNGKNFTRHIAHELSQKDYVIVSGMAKGIDTAAHVGALANTDGTGGTIAVLGTALTDVYPIENKELFNNICTRGCVISEFAFGTPIAPQNFPRRNRIIAGLSKGVLVIEAQARSGSLITARLAKEQGRDVFAVPGFPLDTRSEGPNKLLKQGAMLVENAQDITSKLEDIFHPFQMNEPNFEGCVQPISVISPKELEGARALVVENLNTEPAGVDDLIRETGLPVQIVNIILVELELAGRIERHPGNRVSLLATFE